MWMVAMGEDGDGYDGVEGCKRGSREAVGCCALMGLEGRRGALRRRLRHSVFRLCAVGAPGMGLLRRRLGVCIWRGVVWIGV